MSTVVWVTLGVMLVVVSPFVLRQLQRRHAAAGSTGPARLSRKESARPANPFAAVSISPGADSPCEAVLKIHQQRFLAVRAPRLPVAGCDRKKCGCRYIRYTDRRARGDRRDLYASFAGFLPPEVGKERRERTDRRKKDT